MSKTLNFWGFFFTLVRWRTFLDSGCKLGQDMYEAWTALQEEAKDGAAWHGEEITGPLSVEVASAGEGCTTGETRGKIVEHREMMMGRLLDEGLIHYHNQAARPVCRCGAGRRGTNSPASGSSPSQGTITPSPQRSSPSVLKPFSASPAQPAPLCLGLRWGGV